MGNFVDFVLAAQTNLDLVKGFLGAADENALKQFFNDNGYSQITPDDCMTLIRVKNNLDPNKIATAQGVVPLY